VNDRNWKGREEKRREEKRREEKGREEKRHRIVEKEVAALSSNELHVRRTFAFGLGLTEVESK
jgi:hypothetical protein